MRTLYLRVEAVNLGNFIGDTEDLSTIRGSGLMILDLRKSVKTAFDASFSDSQVACISHGASQAVFEVTLESNLPVQTLVDTVASTLRRALDLKFATLMVDGYEGTFLEAREALLAKNRWRQMRQLSVSPAGLFPNLNSKSAAHPPWCSIDMVRPVAQKQKRKEADEFIGQSVHVRRAWGIEKKQKFYAEEPGVEWKPQFGKKTEAAWDFHQISQREPKTGTESPIPANLYGKTAVIYLDGNGFGKKQQAFCTDTLRQQAWDRAVQSRRATALSEILKQAWDPQATDRSTERMWWFVDSDESTSSQTEVWRHRFETLLWGGDEVLWVVPAWFGVSVLRTFFRSVENQEKSRTTKPASTTPVANRSFSGMPREMKNLTPSAKKAAAPTRETVATTATTAIEYKGPLTYSGGLVFCHAEAPIQAVIQLAKALADECKSVFSSPNSERNCFSYVVLESFDQLGSEIQRARRLHLPFSPDHLPDSDDPLAHLILDSTELTMVLPSIFWMRRFFPRSSVYQILQALRLNEDPTTEKSKFKRLYDRALYDVPESEKKKEGIPHPLDHFNLSGQSGDVLAKRRVNWLHLAELWDYAMDWTAPDAVVLPATAVKGDH